MLYKRQGIVFFYLLLNEEAEGVRENDGRISNPSARRESNKTEMT